MRLLQHYHHITSPTKKQSKRQILIEQSGRVDLHHDGKGRRELVDSLTFDSQLNDKETRRSATVTEGINDGEGRNHCIVVEHTIVFDHTAFSLQMTVRMKKRRACSCFR